MPADRTIDQPFRLGRWTVQPRLSSLRSPAGSIHLEPKAMDLLVFLAARSGQVVSKVEILEAVWEGRAVSDDVLTGTISQLRRALGDDARRPTWIETIPKRGYRLLVPVGEVPGEESPGKEIPGTPEEGPRAPRARRRTLGLAAAGLLSLVVAGGTAWLLVTGGSAPESGATGDGAGQAAQAAEACRKGREALALRTPISLRQAELYFQQALSLDPEQAAAQAGLADTYCLMVDAGVDAPARLFPRARQAADAALALDPDLAEAHSARATVLFLHDRDFAAAEEAFRRALELDPGYVPAHRLYAFMLSALGRHGEAVAEAERALELDPYSLQAHRDLGEILLLARRYDQVIDRMRATLTLDPDFPDAHLKMGYAYFFLGRPAEAYAAFRAAFEGLGLAPELLARLDQAFAGRGLPEVFRLTAQAMEEDPLRGNPRSLTDRAVLYGAAGDREQALAALQQADARRDPNLLWLAVAPYADPLRSDPRFARLVAHLGLPAPPSGPEPGS